MAVDKEATITLKLTKPEALALIHAADTGLRVIDTLGLVKALGLTETAGRDAHQVALP
jgi:hypothetical protein